MYLVAYITGCLVDMRISKKRFSQNCVTELQAVCWQTVFFLVDLEGRLFPGLFLLSQADCLSGLTSLPSSKAAQLSASCAARFHSWGHCDCISSTQISQENHLSSGV